MWTTYSICALLERIWAEHRETIQTIADAPSHSSEIPSSAPPATLVEIVAVLERALAYAHTGNAKVLSTKVMGPLWLVRSLLRQGLPTLAPQLLLGHSQTYTVSIALGKWPKHDITGVPFTSSGRAQILTYGQPHYDVSFLSIFWRLLVRR